MSEHLPARVDRAAIERIIQRAAELQTGERDIGESLTPDEVIALGREVGIPEPYLRQALLEERGRLMVPPPRGFLDRAMGDGVVTAQRVVRGEPEDVERALIAYVEDEELLTIQRQQAGRITWEPLRGMKAALKRGSAVFGRNRQFMLARAATLVATVTRLEPGYCHVALTADLRPVRAANIGGIAAVGSVGVAATVVLSVLSAFWLIAIAPLPLALGAGWGISKRFRPVPARTLLGLERALDHLERGAIKPAHALQSGSASLVGSILDEVRRAIEGPR
ncbi:MAG: hypothetical protein OEW17_11245 [Gemmatimonadota bacterium]|nr:hypothetical protein [Gemmatimonadota bacterium]MDH4349373.1 hypothetical protein [Gemmatimonadota bacterium]MDH5282245.1 hypothetical protein [Gemmatimonadota bacterium]